VAYLQIRFDLVDPFNAISWLSSPGRKKKTVYAWRSVSDKPCSPKEIGKAVYCQQIPFGVQGLSEIKLRPIVNRFRSDRSRQAPPCNACTPSLGRSLNRGWPPHHPQDKRNREQDDKQKEQKSRYFDRYAGNPTKAKDGGNDGDDQEH
jgi:hypothetical protein